MRYPLPPALSALLPSRTPSIGRRVCALLDREFPSNATWNQRLTLAGWFPTWDQKLQARYLLHWTDHEEKLEEEGFACAGDSAPYGDCWQATYEPVYGTCEKPTDAAKEKARMIWKKTGKVLLAKEGSLFSDSCRAMIT